MKFTVAANALKDLSAPVEAATLPKSNVADYCHILVVVDDANTLSIAGNNGKFMASVSGVPVDGTESGRTLVPSGVWQQIVRQSAGATITFESDTISYANIVTADNGTRQEYNIHVLPADDYETMPFSNEVVSFGIDRFAFGEALSVVKPTVDSENSFEVVNGICLEVEATGVHLVATNIKTLGYAKVPPIFNMVGEKQVSAAPPKKITRVIPRGGVDLVERVLTNSQGDLIVRFSEGLVRFEVGNVVITTSLLANGTDYINWQRMVPDAIDGPAFTADVTAVLDAARKAEIVNAGEATPVDFAISPDGVTAAATGSGGSFFEKVASDKLYGNAGFRMDSKVVRSALRSLEGATKLEVATVNEGSRIQVVPTLPTLKGDAYQIWAVLTRKAA